MNRRTARLAGALATITLAGVALVATTALTAGTASAAGGPNLAAGRAATASTVNGPYAAANLTDGNQGTYWESANNAFPQWAQVDLGSASAIDQVVLKLPAGLGDAHADPVRAGQHRTARRFSTIVGSAGTLVQPGSGNTVTINFGATTTRYVRVNDHRQHRLVGRAARRARGLRRRPRRPATSPRARRSTASGQSAPYGAGNANDGNQGSYWESANNAFPQWLQVDLGAAVSVNRVVLKLPTDWGARTQTLSVQGSTNGTTFSDLVASAGHAFNPATGNTVTHHVRRGHHPVRAAAHHRQHRLAGRPALRVRGLRPDHRRHAGPDRAGATSPSPSRPPARSGSPGTRPPTTSASPATTSTPTTCCAPAWPAPC